VSGPVARMHPRDLVDGVDDLFGERAHAGTLSDGRPDLERPCCLTRGDGLPDTAMPRL
jgi:hypothetical protein